MSKQEEQNPKAFEPYIAPDTQMPELTVRGLILGTILGVIFGASSLYLVLKVGLTVSASIPVAVISVTFFRLLSKLGFRDATILENNIVQTAGSAGESIAFGVGVTMPAILILGFDLELTRVMLVGVLGGLLGILMMIPLRRALIVQQHGILKYPEGTACAEVLKAGASKESIALSSATAKAEAAAAKAAGLGENASSKTIFGGFGIGFLYQLCIDVFKLWKGTPEKIFTAKEFKGGSISGELTPALLGVGYIIGPRISAVMTAGGVLSYLVLIPLITFFGDAIPGPLDPGKIPISEMGPGQIRGAYILYIGAGAVAAGGLISLARSLPTIWRGLREGLKDLRRTPKVEVDGKDPYRSDGAASLVPTLRTEQDMPIRFVLTGVLVLIVSIIASPSLQMNLLGALMIILFGFLFVTVSSRLTGEIGSSSNPISGMTVATLLLTCLVFLLLGWTGSNYYVTALSVGGIVCISASNGGTTSQDLKTGYLVGATPRLQQISILVGAGISALFLGPILLVLNDSATVYLPAVTFPKMRGELIKLDDIEATMASPYQGEFMPPVEGKYRLFEQSPEAAKEEGATLQPGEYLINEQNEVVFSVSHNFEEDLETDASLLTKKEKLLPPQNATDDKTYLVWQEADKNGNPIGKKYLVNDSGKVIYLVDPGINGVAKERPDGTEVKKYDAPKATLMSYIIKGILNRELPWALVLFGVMIAFTLELAGIPSLAFAVGLYIPLSSSTPILMGGLVRWAIDRNNRNKLKDKNLTEEQLAAEADKSPGVLMASGYIAGGAIAGIIVAFVAGVFTNIDEMFTRLSESNPFVNSNYADLLSVLPFAILSGALYLVGREKLFSSKK